MPFPPRAVHQRGAAAERFTGLLSQATIDTALAEAITFLLGQPDAANGNASDTGTASQG